MDLSSEPPSVPHKIEVEYYYLLYYLLVPRYFSRWLRGHFMMCATSRGII